MNHSPRPHLTQSPRIVATDAEPTMSMTGREWAEQYRDAILQLRPDAQVTITSSNGLEAAVTSDQHDMAVHFVAGAPSGGSSMLMVANSPVSMLGLVSASLGLAYASHATIE